jgi:hypothetical protein
MTATTGTQARRTGKWASDRAQTRISTNAYGMWEAELARGHIRQDRWSVGFAHLIMRVHQLSNLDQGWVRQPLRGG